MNFFLITTLASVFAYSNNLFDIVYVNLESRPDRKQHVENLLSFANCKFERFNAVNGIELLTGKRDVSEYTSSSRFNKDIAKYKNFDSSLFGMAGCKLSHQIIWDNISRTNKRKPTLIVEDDLDLTADFVTKVETALADVGKKWDIILLSQNYDTMDENPFGNKTNLVKVGFFYECLAYIVKDAETAEKIIMGCYQFGSDFPIDLCIGNMAQRRQIEAYAFKPRIALQKRELFGTNIISSEQTLTPQKLENSLMEKYMAETKN